MRSQTPIALLTAFATALSVLACSDPVPGARQEIVDGRFSHWPDAAEADAWRIDGDATLTLDSGHLEIRAIGDDTAGAVSLVPLVPQRTYRFSLRHRGGAGQAAITVDDLGSRLVLDLPASSGWSTVERELVPDRDGVRVRLLDHPADSSALSVDDVSMVLPSEGAVHHEPPIRILTVAHAETDVITAERYWERRTNLERMVDQLETHGLRLTLLVSGPFAEWALHEGDAAFYASLQDRGHEIGTYVFPLYWSEPLEWSLGPIFDEGMPPLLFADHRSWVDQLVAPQTNRTVCAYAPIEQMPLLMEGHGFVMDLASVAVTAEEGSSRESVAWQYLGHHPHHPFRPADLAVEGMELAGDRDAPYVTVGHAAQVGRDEAHGAPCLVSDYERIFDQMLDRWLAHRRAPAAEGEDLVWTFGLLHNLAYGETYDDEFVSLLELLSERALDATTEDGAPIATAATASELYTEFIAWEADHPDETGFSFTLPP